MCAVLVFVVPFPAVDIPTHPSCSVLRFERGGWSMAKSLRQATTNEHPPPRLDDIVGVALALVVVFFCFR